MSIETWEIPFEAYKGKEPYIFVSYAHKDHDQIFGDLGKLYLGGFRLWYDEGIDPGNEWAEEVAAALNGCSFFIVFISPNAVASSNVRNEINFALNHKKRFLAIYITPTSLPPGLELRISDIQAIFRFRMELAMYFRKLEHVLSDFRDRAGLAEPPAGRAALGSTRIDVPAPNDIGGLQAAVEKFQRENDWAKVRELGASVGQMLLDRLAANPLSLPDAIKLLNLGVSLTDADSLIWARRCFDAAAASLLEQIKENGETPQVLDFLGMVYNNLGRMARKYDVGSRTAESFYRKSVEIFEKLYPVLSDGADLGDRLGMAYTNLGNSLSSQKKLKSAREAYQSAVQTYEQITINDPGNARIEERLNQARRTSNALAHSGDD